MITINGLLLTQSTNVSIWVKLITASTVTSSMSQIVLVIYYLGKQDFNFF